MPSACPNCRRLTVNRGLKRVAAPCSTRRSAAVDCPHQVGSQADSAGSIPVTRSTGEKRCSTREFGRASQAGRGSFTPETAPVPLRVPSAILTSAPGRLSVPKLTVRLQFPGTPLLRPAGRDDRRSGRVGRRAPAVGAGVTRSQLAAVRFTPTTGLLGRRPHASASSHPTSPPSGARMRVHSAEPTMTGRIRAKHRRS